MIAPVLLALQAAAPAPAGQATPVSPVVVEAPRDAPRLVRTYPAAGAAAPFGVVVLTVSFDQPMDEASAPKALGPSPPDCRPSWRLLNDRRTFVRLCALKSGEAARLDLSGFRSTQAKPAPAVALAFTGDADKVDASLEEALKSAALKPEDGPVMDWSAPPAPPAASGG